MSYGIKFDGRDGERERGFCAAAAAVCLVAVLVIALGWLGGIGARELWRGVTGKGLEVRGETGYPDPVCDVCGMILDGTHTGCEPEGFNKSAACSSARGTGEP
jgi:hypothetical protein